jgi:hypothetical protein
MSVAMADDGRAICCECYSGESPSEILDQRSMGCDRLGRACRGLNWWHRPGYLRLKFTDAYRLRVYILLIETACTRRLHVSATSGIAPAARDRAKNSVSLTPFGGKTKRRGNTHRLPAWTRSAGDPCLDDFKLAAERDEVGAIARRNRSKLGL